MVVAGTSQIVGRERERTQLRQILDDSIAGRGSLILISGEAGIGKTTLVNDLVQHAREQGSLVLTGGCYDLTTTPPYGPWIEITRSYPMTDDALPEMPEQLREGTALASVRSQTELFELVSGFFATVSAHRPLVLALEDLHWSDPASLELLRYLGRRCTTDGILVVATYRDDELTRQHPLFQLLPGLVRETGAARIELHRLTSNAIRDLALASGLADTDATRLVGYLDQRTSGIPLFVTELLRALDSEGVLRVTADGAFLGELDESYLPSFVLQIIERRLTPLEPETRRALEVAAIIGQEVPFDVWESVGDLNQELLDIAIEQALAAHVLEETPDRRGLRFTHALIREVLYGGVVLTRRMNWHQRTADALMAGADPDPDTVAFHLEQTNDPRLADWLVRAGERAEQRQATLMAAERYERAQLLLWNDSARVGERAWLLFRTGLLLRHAEWDKSIQYLEEAEMLARRAKRPVIAHLARAHQGLPKAYAQQIREGLDDMQAGIEALEKLDAADSAELGRLTAALGGAIGVQGRGTLALYLAWAGRFEEARDQLAEWPAGEWETSPDAYRARGIVAAALGQPVEAHRALERSAQIYAGLSDAGQIIIDLYWLLLNVHRIFAADNIRERHELQRAQAELVVRDARVPVPTPDGPEGLAELPAALDAFLRGDWDRAQALLDRELPVIYSAHFDFLRARLALVRGDAATVSELVRRYLPEGPATEPGTRYYQPLSDFQPLAVELALDAGRLDEARAWLEANDRLLEWSGAVAGRAERDLLWARYQLLNDDPPSAHRHARRALRHASDPRQPLALLAAHRFLGHLDSLDGQFADAEDHLQHSLDLAVACQTPFERALTVVELARLRIAQGQPGNARDLLDEVRSICEPLKAQPTLDQIAALEEQLQQSTPAPTPFGLTPRELDVLQLVAEGLTDPEVAEQLFVSPRTVSSHLTSIYTKLNVSSRTAATRLAVEHGLL